MSLQTPPPPAGSFKPAAARRGRRLWVPFLHEPTEVGTDPAYAARTATGKYRTTPLRGLWQHVPYFHDGSAPDLLAVVNHYDRLFGLHLTAGQKADLVEFLKTL